MFRLLLTGILVYLGYRMIKGFSSPEKKESKVQGRQNTPPADFKSEDIEDAQYEDISEK